MTKSAAYAEVMIALERQHSSYEMDLLIGSEIRKVAMLPNNSKAACIFELLGGLDHLVARRTLGVRLPPWTPT